MKHLLAKFSDLNFRVTLQILLTLISLKENMQFFAEILCVKVCNIRLLNMVVFYYIIIQTISSKSDLFSSILNLFLVEINFFFVEESHDNNHHLNLFPQIRSCRCSKSTEQSILCHYIVIINTEPFLLPVCFCFQLSVRFRLDKSQFKNISG